MLSSNVWMELPKLFSPGVGKKSFCPCQLLRQKKNILQFFQLMMSKHSANISAEINSQSNLPDINPRLFLIFPLFFQVQACQYPNQETAYIICVGTTICLQGAFHTRSVIKTRLQNDNISEITSACSEFLFLFSWLHFHTWAIIKKCVLKMWFPQDQTP